MDDSNARAMVYKASWGERFWRWAGWHGQYPELPPEVDKWPGWAATTVRIQLSIGDRLRLLINGRMRLRLRHAADVQFNEMVMASSLELVSPVDREWKAPQ